MYLRLLGSPEVETAAGAIRFLPERPYQLLAYLAGRGEWVTREPRGTNSPRCTQAMRASDLRMR